MKKGILISFEGVDGAGKTTQLKNLQLFLKEQGFDVVAIREPGGTLIAEKIRDLLLDARNQGLEPLAEALLYSAARAQMVQELLKPLLNQGKIVVADRFIDSTIAYQGYGRGLDIEVLTGLNRLATQGLEPDLTFLLDIDPVLARKRRDGENLDRLEQEGLAFQVRIREGYLKLAARYSRFVIIDGADPPDQVAELIRTRLAGFLKGMGENGQD